MTDWLTITLTAATTLIGGMILFVFAEFAKALIITPLHKYKEQVQLTLDRLDFYSNRLTNFFPERPSKDDQVLISQIETDLRSAATQLKSKYVTISWKKVLITFKVIPTPEHINIAYTALMYLQNSILYESSSDEHNNPKANNSKIDEVKMSLTIH